MVLCEGQYDFHSALLGKSLKAGWSRSEDSIPAEHSTRCTNAVNVAELAVEKGAEALLIPISARKQLNDLSDEMAMKLSILYYADAREALLEAWAIERRRLLDLARHESGALNRGKDGRPLQ